MKSKFTRDYSFGHCSVAVLWKSISTAQGLADWFAFDVSDNKKSWSFVWDDDVTQQAYCVLCRPQECVRFKWADEDDSGAYFEFSIYVDELTGNVSLSITDFAEENEIHDAVALWEKQIQVLHRALCV